MKNDISEKISFIKRISNELLPLFPSGGSEKDIIERLKNGDFVWYQRSRSQIDSLIYTDPSFPVLDDVMLDDIFDIAGTMIFYHTKPGHSLPGKKSVLLSAQHAGAWTVINGLLPELLEDERCGAIVVLVSDFSAKLFEEKYGKEFLKFPYSGKGTVLEDLSYIMHTLRVEVVLNSPNDINAPDSVLLFGAKSAFGAKKQFLFLDSWGNAIREPLLGGLDRMEEIDGIFTNDELARQIAIVGESYSRVSPEKIYGFGTPVIDSIDNAHAHEYKKVAREKMNISQKEIVILYLGGISYSVVPNGASADIDEKSFEMFFDGCIKIAGMFPQKNICIAFRPHPRDPRKEEKYNCAKTKALPANALFKDSAAPLSVNEACYGADIIASIMSAENFLAPLRGKRSIFVAFSGKGMGLNLLTDIYGRPGLIAIAETWPDVRVAFSAQTLEQALRDFISRPPKTLENNAVQTSSAKKIIDIIFS